METDVVETTGELERPLLPQVDGDTLQKSTCRIWGKIWAFQARPDDLVIASYPKAGTTWTQEIVDLIQNGRDLEQSGWVPIHLRQPFLEMDTDIGLLWNRPGKCNAFPKDPEKSLSCATAATILLGENLQDNLRGKDTIVSYYHFQRMNRRLPNPRTWDEYFDTFLAGKVCWGSCYDHVKGWWRKKDSHPILHLFYEEMLKARRKYDPKREIRKVMEFLGKNLKEEVLDKTVYNTSFAIMKNNPTTDYTNDMKMNHQLSLLMRKGDVYLLLSVP